MHEFSKIKKQINEYNKDLPSVQSYINLILIYWSISYDYGLETECISKKIFVEEEIREFPQKVNDLILKATEQHKNNSELQFWTLFINEMNSFDEGVNKKQIKNLTNDKNFLLPYFYLYLQEDEIQLNNLQKLVDELKKSNTFKSSYVLSYLENIEEIR